MTFARTDPRRYFEAVGPQRADRAEGHQPLQPVVRDLPAHIRDAGTTSRHELRRTLLSETPWQPCQGYGLGWSL
jgi:hypothetical protein